MSQTGINAPLNRKLRMALIGGGGAGFIGRVHYTAATLDHRAELVAGVLSSDPERGKRAAAEFGIPEHRAYGAIDELIEREQQLPGDERVEFVSIATPNFTHAPIAEAALQAGLHVFCDKPMTTQLEDARRLARQVEQSGCVFALTHNYSGYPMIRQARDMVRAGELGEIQAVRAHYLQGWMRGVVPGAPAERGMWKSDPSKTGPTATLGDVGTHAYHLARYVTGLQPQAVSCLLRQYIRGNPLDDYGHVVVRFADAALGSLTVSQGTHGRLNDLSLEVDGTRASIAWRQEEPNQLILRKTGAATQILDRAPQAPYTTANAAAASRLPPGHPEAFFEAFANVYRAAFDEIVRQIAGEPPRPTDEVLFPTVADGVEGVAFLEQCVASAAEDGLWKPLDAGLNA